MERKYIQLNQKDNSITLLENAHINDVIIFDKGEILLTSPIQAGHKIACKKINPNADIIKYGQVIGKALCEINIGEHIHSHNCISLRGEQI